MKVELDKDIRTREVLIGMRPDYPHAVEWIEEVRINSSRPGTLYLLRIPYEYMDDLLEVLLQEKHRHWPSKPPPREEP